MAIAPNTTFVANTVLTAAQQNAFGFGIVARDINSTTDSTVTVEEQEVAPVTFTAIANRYYKLTYYEPGFGSTTGAAMTMRIRQTNITGTILQQGIVYNTGTQQQNGVVIGCNTFAAGSTTVLATLQNSAGTGSANRSVTAYALLLVEDIGPA